MIQSIATIIRQAGEIMLGAQKPAVYEKEGHANFVTQTDIDVQTFLIEHLHQLMPEALFLAEEQENLQLTEGLTFVIDPIDGTTNFMHSRRASCISVGLLRNRQLELAFVYQPWLREMYAAERGKGAFCNDRRLQASNVPFEHAVVNIGTAPYQPELSSRSMKLAAEFLGRTSDLRRCGSAALDLCDVAAGGAELFWEMELSPWDYAAGALIVTEAGGKIATMRGDALVHGTKTSVLASNPACFEAAVALCAGAMA
ncbi:MAG: inositol monophosphatase family protein [Clostridia bacterium]